MASKGVPMLIPVELSRIVIRDNSEQQYIYISETNGLRGFPIIIGSYEANEINRKVSEVETPRPMTHDLIR
ncbi:MAG: bifunctional nuclease domain-containing protein, partial [Planctomycetota bacterium]